MIPVAFLLESFWQDWEMSSKVGSLCVPSLLEESMPVSAPSPSSVTFHVAGQLIFFVFVP